MITFLRNLKIAINKIAHQPPPTEHNLLILGKLAVDSVKAKKTISSLSEVEFKVFSQFGDDGIIQWLIHNLDIPNKTFVEFGVENYRESNTRFLLMNNNWSGFVMDASEQCVAQIVNSEYYWRHQLTAKAAFVDEENVNSLVASSGFEPELGLLHIDIDGNDYWIWKKLKYRFTCLVDIGIQQCIRYRKVDNGSLRPGFLQKQGSLFEPVCWCFVAGFLRTISGKRLCIHRL